MLPGEVTGELIAPSAITATKISNDAVTTPAIAALAITANKIATNTITANQIAARGITADRIQAYALTATELAANTIRANNLSVSTRPFSVYGGAFRVDTDGVLRWNSCYVQYVDDSANYVSVDVQGGAIAPDGQVWYLYYTPSTHLIYGTHVEQIQGDPAVFFVGKWHGTQDSLNLSAGVGTFINGAQVVTGSINADKIVARSIGADRIATGALTANEIAAGTITAAQVATGALTASVIATGNPDSIVGDSDFRDPKWWSGGGVDSRLTVGETGMAENRRELLIAPGGGIDILSMFFAAEPGATYRISFGVYTYANFSGSFRPMIHVPNNRWMSLKASGAGMDPGDTNPIFNYTTAGQYYQHGFEFTNPYNPDQGRWQFRLSGSWTGQCAFTVKIVRVSDTTLIKNGAVTTDKIVVNSLNGDRITAGTLSADKIAANTVLSSSVTVNGQALNSIQQSAANASGAGWASFTPGYYTAYGNKIMKTGGTANWETNAYTTSPIRNAATIKGRFVSDETFIGLAPNADGSNYGGINWAWHRSGNGNMMIFEGGTGYVVALASDLGADVVDFSVVYDGKTIRYYSNEYLRREVAAPADLAVFGVVSIATPGKYVDRVQFFGSADNSLNRADPAARINAASTQIDPGKITILGGTSLANWRQGGDETRIAGGSISANTISANKLTIGNRGINIINLQFRVSADKRYLYWDAGHISYQDEAGNVVTPYVNGGGVDAYNNGGTYFYVYWNKGAGYLDVSYNDPSAAMGDNKILLCTWVRGTERFNANYGGTIIHGDSITTGTINADRIVAGSVLANNVVISGYGSLANAYTGADWGAVRNNDGNRPQNGATVGAPSGTYVGNTEAQQVTNWAYTGAQDPATRINQNVTTIDGGKITTGSITAGQIAAYSISADRLSVGSLSAISANIGSLVSYNGAGGRVERDGNGTRVYGNNGVLRVKIGF